MLWDTLMPDSLNWEVGVQPIYRSDGSKIPGKREVFRIDTDQHLAIVGKGYTPIQNVECQEFLSHIEGTIEKCGILDDGKKVWWVIKLPGSLNVAGEKLYKYSVLVNAFDGKTGFRWFITPVRPACSNMMNLLIQSAVDFNLFTRHTRFVKSRVEAAAELFNNVQAVYQEMEAQFNILANTQFTMTLENYISAVFGTRDMAILAAINKNIAAAWPVSMWQVLNATTQYIDFQRPMRGKNQDARRFGKALFGSLKQRAYDVIINAMPAAIG